jgi:hypothetical protein
MMPAIRAKYSQPLLATAIGVLAVTTAGTAQAACTYQYGTLSATNPNVGNVISAANGETVFTVPATSSGGIIKSGAGSRLSTGGAVLALTIQANNHSHCDTSTISGSISASGSPTGRAKAMRNFDVSGTGVGNESGTTTRTFTISAFRNLTRTIYIGLDFPIKGDNEGGTTGGTSQSSFTVTLTPSNGNAGSRTGTGVATVRRSIQLTKTSDLSFGKIVRPSTASGNTVAVNALSGLRSITGAGNAVAINLPAATRAGYIVTGEGGQTFSIGAFSPVTMTGPGGTLTVTLTKFPTTGYQLTNSLNQNGTYEFWVGGSFPITSSTVPGLYTGAFNVTVSYN